MSRSSFVAMTHSSTVRRTRRSPTVRVECQSDAQQTHDDERRNPMTSTPAASGRNARVTVLSAVFTLALVAGCGASSHDSPPVDDRSEAPSAGETDSLTDRAETTSGPLTERSTTYPMVLDNCGHEVTVHQAPERVVTIKSTPLELMLALGLEDRIVGYAFPDGPMPDRWADAAAALPLLSDRVPSQEAVLTQEPDLIYAGWESNLETGGDSTREQLAGLGVASYVAPSACQGQGYQPDPMSFDLLFEDFAQVGEIFDVQDQAEELIAAQRQQLEAIEPDPRGLSALWFSSGSDTPFVGAGIGAPQMMMQAAGLDNIAATVSDTWTSMGWEAIIDADPDVIVLIDADWNTAASKIDQLSSHPATAELTAVQHERYVVVPFPAGEAGVRNVDAVASIVDQLQEMDL